MTKNLGTDRLILMIILIVGGVLRFYNYHQLPYSYDEFSALFRTRFDSFSDLIRLGVVQTDTHPAGVQVFMYFWVKLVGEGEMLVKLPFVLAGVASIYIVYRIAETWFNASVGLVTALFIAFLQYPITYSQYARPYASGMFLALLLVWFFHQAFFQKHRSRSIYAVGYVVVAALNTYNHHFSLFFLGLVGFTGLFAVPRRMVGRYLVIQGCVFFLYLPHIGIFFEQLHKGGVESWLRKPEPTFFIDYLGYIIHFSWLLGVTVVVLLAGSLFFIWKTARRGNRYRLLMVVWLVVTYATAYLYSIHRNAVLQYSVLLFTFPFLVMLVFSFMGNLRAVYKWSLLLIFGTVSIYTLVVERRHYSMQYESVLEQTFAETARVKETYRSQSVACMTNISQKVQSFYSDKYHIDPGEVIHFDSSSNYIRLRTELEQLSCDYLVVGWVNISHLEAFAVAREVFPVVMDHKCFYTGDYYLLARQTNPDDTAIRDFIIERVQLDSLRIFQNAAQEGITMLWDHERLIMAGWLPYANFYKGPVSEVVQQDYNYVLMRMQVENPKPDYKSMLVCEVKRNDSSIYWTANPFELFTQHNWGRYHIHLGLKLQDLNLDMETDEFHIYLVNTDEKYYYLNNFNLDVLQGNPNLYGLFKKIQN